MEIEGLPYAPVCRADLAWRIWRLVTRDMDRATAFYAALLLGRGVKKPQPGRTGGAVRHGWAELVRCAALKGAWLPAGNLQLELWQFHAPPSPPEPAPRQAVRSRATATCASRATISTADAALLACARRRRSLAGSLSRTDGLRYGVRAMIPRATSSNSSSSMMRVLCCRLRHWPSATSVHGPKPVGDRAMPHDCLTLDVNRYIDLFYNNSLRRD